MFSSLCPPCSTVSTTIQAGTLCLRYVIHSFCRDLQNYHGLQSPLPLTSPSDFRFPTPCEDQAIDNGSLVVEVQANGVQERVFPQGYSSMFRMGLLFMVRGHSLDQLYIHFC